MKALGPKRRQMLLKTGGGLQGLRNASVEEIAKVPGISQGLATKISGRLKHRCLCSNIGVNDDNR
ncbi:helix-hairpin-helix domain-containing protein [Escherichia coli]